MKTNKLGFFLGVCCFAVLGMTLSAFAQKTVVKSKHGAWNIQCEGRRNKTVNAVDLVQELQASKKKDGAKDTAKTKKAADKNKCAMVQAVKSKERKNVGLSIILFKTKRKDKSDGALLRVLAPAGVFLPNGLAMEIDGKAKGRIGFLRCLPNGCIAQAELTKDLLSSLQSGGAANFIIYEAPGRGLSIPVSLKGFTAAYKALKY